MRSSFLVVGATLLSAFVASATDFPTAEAFLGYNFVRFNPNSGYAPSFNANGGSGQIIYNFNKWVGGVFDMGAVTKGTLNQINVDSTVMNFVAGPRFTWFNHSRFLPYANVMFGGAYSTFSAPVAVPAGVPLPGPFIVLNPNLDPFSARVVTSHTGFAMMAGGGLDIKLSKHIAFRPIGADYYLTRLSSNLTGGVTNRNNFRYSAGVTFLFGGAK